MISVIKILFFGDIFGKIGRKAIKKVIPLLKKKINPQLILANGENLAHGLGVTKKVLKEIKKSGIDFLTSGNHIWDKKEIEEIFLDQEFKNYIIRPANYPEGLIGKGAQLLRAGKFLILVINLLGRVFIKEDLDCPFRKLEQILDSYKSKKLSAILVDFHAEATSEKNAFGWWADGRVSAVLGSHTHIGTADAKILPQGTGYLTDLGMVGAKNSVLGLEKTGPLKEFLTQVSQTFEIPEKGEVIINAVYLEINPKTRKTIKIRRIDLETTVE